MATKKESAAQAVENAVAGLREADALFLDLFEKFIEPLENEQMTGLVVPPLGRRLAFDRHALRLSGHSDTMVDRRGVPRFVPRAGVWG